MRLPLTIAMFLAIASSAAPAQTFHSSSGDIKVATLARGLVHPWSLAFLPDSRMLVTERPGRIRIVTFDGNISPPVANVPGVVTGAQAGLMDIILDRDYTQTHVVYFCFNADRGGDVAVARARLTENETPRLDDVQIIFRQSGPPSPGGLNVGCRMVQWQDGNLFITLGDHFSPRNDAQNLADTIGKIVRIRPDGSVPDDNPFVGKSGAKPEIWSYGHRNAQGLAINPADGKLWEQEHGPQGGDEINIIEKGKNYGWPVIGFGIDYNGARIHASTSAPGMEQPVWHWTPSIAPSGMMFYSGKLWPAWKGSLFNGALKFELVARLEIKGENVIKEERLLRGLTERIRDVREGPDGAIYLLTDNTAGRILRLEPAR